MLYVYASTMFSASIIDNSMEGALGGCVYVSLGVIHPASHLQCWDSSSAHPQYCKLYFVCMDMVISNIHNPCPLVSDVYCGTCCREAVRVYYLIRFFTLSCILFGVLSMESFSKNCLHSDNGCVTQMLMFLEK